MDKEMMEKELFFLKEEQRYMENKLNIAGVSISAVNSLILVGLNNYFKFDTNIYIGIIVLLLLPISFFLIGIFPFKSFFIKSVKKENDKLYNLFSKYRENWNEANIISHLDYQIKNTIQTTKRKKEWVCYTIICEIVGVIAMIIWLISITS